MLRAAKLDNVHWWAKTTVAQDLARVEISGSKTTRAIACEIDVVASALIPKKKVDAYLIGTGIYHRPEIHRRSPTEVIVHTIATGDP
jgi:hypothetical protein